MEISINAISKCSYFGVYISIISTNINYNEHVNHLELILFKSSILVGIILFFCNWLSSFTQKDANLLFLSSSLSLTLNAFAYQK